MQWLYQNGKLVQRDDATVFDPPGGRALIETFRAHEGRVFRLAQHYERLFSGAPILGLTVPLTLADLESVVADVLARNDAQDARLRLTVSAGRDPHPLVTLTAAPLTDYPPELYERGMHATIADVRRNEASPLSRIKCAAGLREGVLARERAREAGFEEAIMINTLGLVAEATVANVFLVKGGRLLTPTIESGALPGVTRAAVLDLACEAGIESTETDVTLDDLRTADEAFLTNSVMGVMPLTRLDGEVLGGGQPGEVTRRIARFYAEEIASEVTGAR